MTKNLSANPFLPASAVNRFMTNLERKALGVQSSGLKRYRLSITVYLKTLSYQKQKNRWRALEGSQPAFVVEDQEN